MRKQSKLPIAMIVSGVLAVVAIVILNVRDERAIAAQPAAKAATQPGMSITQRRDIVDTAVAAGQFKTLVTAVQAAGLVEVLKGSGPFTVFAPTDEAFAKVPKETLDALLKDKAALGEVLKYHVVPGKVMSSDVVKVAEAKTVQGKPVKFALKINDATVVKTDIECTNGVIHVIDSVILPPKQ